MGSFNGNRTVQKVVQAEANLLGNKSTLGFIGYDYNRLLLEHRALYTTGVASKGEVEGGFAIGSNDFETSLPNCRSSFESFLRICQSNELQGGTFLSQTSPDY